MYEYHEVMKNDEKRAKNSWVVTFTENSTSAPAEVLLLGKTGAQLQPGCYFWEK
jgi:hypothetical protein